MKKIRFVVCSNPDGDCICGHGGIHRIKRDCILKKKKDTRCHCIPVPLKDVFKCPYKKRECERAYVDEETNKSACNCSYTEEDCKKICKEV